MPKTTKVSKNFDKYEYYLKAVQSPQNDVLFLRDTYKKIKGKAAVCLMEDFCGTFKICCEWVKLNAKNLACGVDIDPEPLSYGKKKHLAELSASQQERVQIFKKDVMSSGLPKADIVAAQNFSYYIFKERKILIEYFKSVLGRLNKEGIFVVDCFGGPSCMVENEEETEHDDFSFFWDQDSFDPVTNYGQFFIHFKRKGEKKREKFFLTTGECGLYRS